MIEQLISLLRQNEISLDDREISDILWLARVLPHAITEEQLSRSPTSSTPNDSQSGSTPRQPDPSRSISATKSKPVKPSVYTSGSSTTGDGDGVRASRVRLPGATALPDAPAISRAFRPFARRYKSGRFRALDIEKTVQRTAETRFLHPVFQASPERWFDVALVVEDTSTMAVWQQTIHELAILLERQGSFRDVRLWRLQCNDKKITVRESSGVGRAPEAINDPSGRRLIMMLSDCSSRAWRDGTLAKVILNWAVSMPVLVAQRLAGSLKMGWVTASLLIGKLNAMPKQNTLVKAMQEYGRLIKTNFILRYLCNPEFRRQIHRQLNKDEALHALRRYLTVAQEGQIRKRYPDDQLNQAHCLNLVTNAVVVWNTVYMWEAIEQFKREGRQIDEEDMKHLSPARYEHINVYGRYFFPAREEMSRKGLRSLRNPGEDD